MTVTKELDLETLVLSKGSHQPSDEEMCVMEAVAYVAGERWTDHPQCASPVIAAFCRRFNDDTDQDGRDRLKPYIYRLVGSKASQPIEDQRAWLVTNWLVHDWLPLWLRAAGMDDQAAACDTLPEIASARALADSRSVLRDLRSAAWAKRDEVWRPWRTEFTAKFSEALKAELAKRNLPAAAADAVDAVDAAAAVDAVAAVAAAAAADAADAVAAAAAADAADAVDAAAAVAAVDAAAAVDGKKLGYWDTYYAVRGAIYESVKTKVRGLIEEKHPELRASSKDKAFELLDAMLALRDDGTI